MGILPNYIAPTIFTLLLHVAVIGAVIAGWQMSDTKRYRVETPNFVKAKLVTLEEQKSRKTMVERKLPPKPPPPVKVEPPKAIERKVKPRRAPDVNDAATVSTAARSSSESKPKAKPKPKPKSSEPVPPVTASREQMQREQESDLQRALAEEENLFAAEEDEILAANHIALIQQRIEGNWSRPPSARKNMEVVLAIRLIPTGDVVGVEVVQSSGNAAFDRSAINAVKRAERFPELRQLPGNVFESNFRSFTLVFKPEDLLL